MHQSAHIIFSLAIAITASPIARAQTPAPPDPVKRSQVYLGPDHRYSIPIASWRELKSQNVVMQQHEYTCGAASLATLLKYCFDEKINEEIVLKAALDKLTKKDLEDRQKNGLSMEDLANGASRLHFA